MATKTPRSVPDRTLRAPRPAPCPAPIHPLGASLGRGALRGSDGAIHIVTFREGAESQALSLMSRSAGIGMVASAADFTEGAVDPEQTQDADVVYFDQLGIAVVNTRRISSTP